MKRISIFSISFVLVILILIIAPVKNVAASDILILMDSLEQKIEWLDYRINLERWTYYTTGKKDSLKYYEDLYAYLLSDEETASKIAKGKKNISDDADVTRWEMLNNAFNSPDIESSSKIAALRDSISTIDMNYRADYNGEQKTSNELYKIFRTNRNRSIRESAYKAWTSIGLELSDKMERLFRLRNQAAGKHGYSNYFSFSFKQQSLKLDEYKQLLKNLDELSRAPYQTILEKIKQKLQVNQLQVWDLGYAYADVQNEVDRYFPIDSQMYFIKDALEDIDINIDKLPIYFDLEPREGKSQAAYAFQIKPPHDMRVLGNLTNGLYSTRTLLHEIGHTLYAAHISQKSHLFKNWISGVWTEAIAQIFASLIESKEGLLKYASVPEPVAKRYIEAKHEQDIIYLRTTLVRLQFELQAYTNSQANLNKLYWNLVDEYMMLPRHEDIKPWAALFYYNTHPVYMQNYLYADMITAQTVAYIKNNYTDFEGNAMTKAFLVQNYLRFGSRYDWQNLLERGTEESLKSEYFIKALGI